LGADRYIVLEAETFDFGIDVLVGTVLSDVTAAVDATIRAGVATTGRGLSTLGR